eukprot:1536741-Heterocapsa_arctica.AAC.1
MSSAAGQASRGWRVGASRGVAEVSSSRSGPLSSWTTHPGRLRNSMRPDHRGELQAHPSRLRRSR